MLGAHLQSLGLDPRLILIVNVEMPKPAKEGATVHIGWPTIKVYMSNAEGA